MSASTTSTWRPPRHAARARSFDRRGLADLGVVTDDRHHAHLAGAQREHEVGVEDAVCLRQCRVVRVQPRLERDRSEQRKVDERGHVFGGVDRGAHRVSDPRQPDADHDAQQAARNQIQRRLRADRRRRGLGCGRFGGARPLGQPGGGHLGRLIDQCGAGGLQRVDPIRGRRLGGRRLQLDDLIGQCRDLAVELVRELGGPGRGGLLQIRQEPADHPLGDLSGPPPVTRPWHGAG